MQYSYAYWFELRMIEYGGRDVGSPASALSTSGMPKSGQDPGQLKKETSNKDASIFQLTRSVKDGICTSRQKIVICSERLALPAGRQGRQVGRLEGQREKQLHVWKRIDIG